jgi:hypothetical protein
MKIHYSILACFSLGFAALVSAANLSDTNNGVYIAIAGFGGQSGRDYVGAETIRFDDKLLWCPFCTTGAVSLNYPDRAYGVRVTMHGPDDKEVTKTSLGEGYGAAFDKLRSYEDVARGWSMGSIEASGAYDPRGGGFTGGPPLPAPKDLFQMDKAGVYTLDIQMQLFQIVSGSNGWIRNLLRFQPVRIKVEKPDPNAKAK